MRRSDLAVLRAPDFRRLFLARTISVLGSTLTPVALTFGILDLAGAGPGDLSLVLAVGSVATLCTVLLGGVLGDRLPRNRVLMIGEAVSALAVGTMAILFLEGLARPPILAILAGIGGLGMGVMFPVLSALVPVTAPPEKLQAANALMRFSTSASQIGGAALAGLLVAGFGSGTAMMVDAISYAVSIAIVARIRAPKPEPSGASMGQQLREGWSEFVSRRWVLAIVIAAAFFNGVFMGCFGVLGPIIAKQHLGGASGWASVLAAFSAGDVIAILVASRYRPLRPMVVVVLLFQPVAIFVLMLGLAPTLPVLAAAGFISGASLTILMVLWDTVFQQQIPPAVLARVSSYDFLGSSVAIPVGVALAGPISARFGVEQTLLAAAAILVATGLAPLFVRDVRAIRFLPEEALSTARSAPAGLS